MGKIKKNRDERFYKRLNEYIEIKGKLFDSFFIFGQGFHDDIARKGHLRILKVADYLSNYYTGWGVTPSEDMRCQELIEALWKNYERRARKYIKKINQKSNGNFLREFSVA